MNNNMTIHEQLKLENQLCFPLYAASRLVTRLYSPLLEELDLTYPQYLVLLVLWEEGESTVSKIKERLLLETSTITPLLKRLEKKGIISRTRSQKDERVVNIELTQQGRSLELKACLIPEQLIKGVGSEFSGEQAVRMQQDLKALIALLK